MDYFIRCLMDLILCFCATSGVPHDAKLTVFVLFSSLFLFSPLVYCYASSRDANAAVMSFIPMHILSTPTATITTITAPVSILQRSDYLKCDNGEQFHQLEQKIDVARDVNSRSRRKSSSTKLLSLSNLFSRSNNNYFDDIFQKQRDEFIIPTTVVQFLLLQDDVVINDKDDTVLSSSTATGTMASKITEKSTKALLEEKIMYDIKNNKNIKFERDEVIRVMDANTIKLKKNGLTSLASIQTPALGSTTGASNTYSECLTNSPSKRIIQLLKPDTIVQVYFVGDTTKKKGFVIRENDQLFINIELVRTGYSKYSPRGREETEKIIPGLIDLLLLLQKEAKENEIGIFETCTTKNQNPDTVTTSGSVVSTTTVTGIDINKQFEPIEYTIQTKWGIDGGKPVVTKREDETQKEIPKNPGDKRGCSDFQTYEDSLRWYEKYKPFYGDVAKLDRDNDGVPCPGLPHTTNPDLYRMKIPTKIKEQKFL